jgi:hypothetical protein
MNYIKKYFIDLEEAKGTNRPGGRGESAGNPISKSGKNTLNPMVARIAARVAPQGNAERVVGDDGTGEGARQAALRAQRRDDGNKGGEHPLAAQRRADLAAYQAKGQAQAVQRRTKPLTPDELKARSSGVREAFTRMINEVKNPINIKRHPEGTKFIRPGGEITVKRGGQEVHTKGIMTGIPRIQLPPKKGTPGKGRRGTGVGGRQRSTKPPRNRPSDREPLDP